MVLLCAQEVRNILSDAFPKGNRYTAKSRGFLKEVEITYGNYDNVVLLCAQ